MKGKGRKAKEEKIARKREKKSGLDVSVAQETPQKKKHQKNLLSVTDSRLKAYGLKGKEMKRFKWRKHRQL